MNKDKVGTKSAVSKHFYASKENVIITSDIWDRDEEYNRLFPQFLPHVGYDYRAVVGTKLVACFDGEVTNVVTGLGSGYGRQVFLYSKELNVTAHYAHLSKVDVKKGQAIKYGTLVGLSGASGATENTYAAHLHFGVAKGRIENAGNKGKALGNVWLDVELFDFEAKPTLKKTNEELAKEVIQGKWGNGQERKDRLTAAGYDYAAIQAIVNKTAGVTPTPPKPVSNVGKSWTNSKTPLTLYNDNGIAYPEPSTAKRSYMILAEKNSMLQIEHAKFRPHKVWVKKSDGVIG